MKLKVMKWKKKQLADGFEFVITDSRGHGLFTACCKGDHKRTKEIAQLLVSRFNVFETK